MDIKLIREFIDKHIDCGYTITICFEETLDRVKFLEEGYTEIEGSSPHALIGQSGNEIRFFAFEDLFNSTYGSNATLFVSYFCDYGEGYSPFIKVFESMNFNTLEVKEIDFEIY